MCIRKMWRKIIKTKIIKTIFLNIIFISITLSSIYGQNANSIDYYIADTSASEVGWFCSHHYGCIKLDIGTVLVKDDIVIGGSFNIAMKTFENEDIVSKILRIVLAAEVKSLPFFECETYPYAFFTIDEIFKLDSNNYYVSGPLEMKGEVRCVNFECEIKLFDDYLTVYSDFMTIDRTDWDINYLSEKFDVNGEDLMYVPDTIDFLIYLYARKTKNFNKKK